MVWKEDALADRKEEESIANGIGGSTETVSCPQSLANNTANTKSTSITGAKPKVVRIADTPQYKPVTGNVRGKTILKSIPISPSCSAAPKEEIIIPVKHEYGLASEPVPTTFSSYKCTKYTLNEVRSF